VTYPNKLCLNTVLLNETLTLDNVFSIKKLYI